MPRSLALGCALVVAAAGAMPARAQTSRADSIAAVAAVAQFQTALAAADSIAAVSLLADDVLIVESGHIQTRAEYLGGHLGADMKASQGPKGVRTVITVSVIGDAAYVVSKTVTPPTSTPGSTGSELAELMVLSKTSAGWKIRAVHWSSRRRRA